MSQPRFRVGDTVHRVNQPENIGVVVSTEWNEITGFHFYRVQFGPSQKRIAEDGLVAFVPNASPWDHLATGTCAGAQQFRVALTYHRLRRPPSRIAHSFASARTQFFPHQFKPLLKFIDRPERRLLVADDVGLGKTIEAGYILRELRAREPHALNRVLVLVPARLTTKWKKELEQRFDEHFDVVRSAEVLEFVQRVERTHELDSYRWIASYESLRNPQVLQAITRTPIDPQLLIADEAHRMRNSSAQQHRLGALLADSAEAVVFLSATPVQNSLADLWNLLRLLSREEFGDWAFFEKQLDANKPILRALRALNSKTPDRGEAEHHLEQFFQTAPGRASATRTYRTNLFKRIREPLSSRRDLVELQADISRLSPTGHILTRTRKFEVMSQRAQRVPGWHSVRLSPAERQIHDNIAGLCHLISGSPASDWGLLMLYRMTASCIPAAMEYFAEKLRGTGQALLDDVIDEEHDDEEDRPRFAPLQSGSSRDTVKDVLITWKSSAPVDSKLEKLVEVLRLAWGDDRLAGAPRRKVVLFSFFRRTLDYLHAALTERGIRNRVMHGGHALADREKAIEEFLELPDVDMLLTSDVGGEGIDLQRASILVNYDLPWNPMVVEQRIGRIDRIGQASERIVICNLVVERSVEERILQRLLSKIRIFEESIGELDGIVGEEIERLTTAALSGKLPESELDQVLLERSDALERQLREANDLRSRMDQLLAADQALLDEIEAITGERQVPTEEELLEFINGTLAQGFPGTQLPREVTSKGVTVDWRGRLGTAMEEWSLRSGEGSSVFARRIAAGPLPLTLSREAAVRHRNVELIHLNHPLVRFCLSFREQEAGRLDVSYRLRLSRSRLLPAGAYVFAISFIEVGSSRLKRSVQAVFASLDDGRVWSDPDETRQSLLELLDGADDIEPFPFAPAALQRARQKIEQALDTFIQEFEERENALTRQRMEQEWSTRRGRTEHFVQRARERLESLRQARAPAFPLRMAEAKLNKQMEELHRLGSDPAPPPRISVESEEIAVGLLWVGAPRP